MSGIRSIVRNGSTWCSLRRPLPNIAQSAVAGDAQELPLNRVDLGEIRRNVVIPAALAGDKMEAPARESLRLTCTAQMNYCGELLLVLWANRCVWPLRENRGHIAVQIHPCEFDGAAW